MCRKRWNLSKKIQNYFPWASTFISVLTLLKMADLNFSWHKQLQSEQLMVGKPQQSNPSGSAVKCFTVACFLLEGASWWCLEEIPCPKGSKSYLELTFLLLLQLQKCCKFSEHGPLALCFLIHKGNKTPGQVRGHVSLSSLPPHCGLWTLLISLDETK